MKTNVIFKNPFLQLPDFVEFNIFNFLTTCDLAKLQSTAKTYKYMRGLVFLRRVHSITRLFPHFDNFVVKCWADRRGWESAIRVRLLWRTLRRRNGYDEVKFGVPINQEDMASTLLRECRILTQIRDKLVNDVGVHPNFENMMDPHSLTDFNRSIEWLERYGIDGSPGCSSFIELLLTNDSDGDFWTSEERVYVDIWKNEFKMWSDHYTKDGFVWP